MENSWLIYNGTATPAWTSGTYNVFSPSGSNGTMFLYYDSLGDLRYTRSINHERFSNSSNSTIGTNGTNSTNSTNEYFITYFPNALVIVDTYDSDHFTLDTCTPTTNSTFDIVWPLDYTASMTIYEL